VLADRWPDDGPSAGNALHVTGPPRARPAFEALLAWRWRRGTASLSQSLGSGCGQAARIATHS